MTQSITRELPRQNVTVVGAFNPAVLSPSWVKRFVPAVTDEISTLIPIEGGPPLFQAGPLYWVVTSERLIVHGPISQAGAMAASIVRTLCHTPLRAAGINFQFQASVDVSKPAIRGRLITGHRGRPGGSFLPRGRLLLQARACARAPAPRAALEEMAVVEHSIEHRGHGCGVAEQPPPVLDGPVRGDRPRMMLLKSRFVLAGGRPADARGACSAVMSAAAGAFAGV